MKKTDDEIIEKVLTARTGSELMAALYPNNDRRQKIDLECDEFGQIYCEVGPENKEENEEIYSVITVIEKLLAIPDSLINNKISDPKARKEFIYWRECYDNLFHNLLPSVAATCIEMGPTIMNDYSVKPLPLNFFDFLTCIDIEYFHPSLNITCDDLLRRYAEWRKQEHYSNEKWHSLYSELSNTGYIETSSEVFSQVMDFKKLPGGANKINWLTSHADEIWFGDSFNFTISQLNKCIRSNNGRPVQAGSRSTTARKEKLTEICQKFSNSPKA